MSGFVEIVGIGSPMTALGDNAILPGKMGDDPAFLRALAARGVVTFAPAFVRGAVFTWGPAFVPLVIAAFIEAQGASPPFVRLARGHRPALLALLDAVGAEGLDAAWRLGGKPAVTALVRAWLFAGEKPLPRRYKKKEEKDLRK